MLISCTLHGHSGQVDRLCGLYSQRGKVTGSGHANGSKGDGVEFILCGCLLLVNGRITLKLQI